MLKPCQFCGGDTDNLIPISEKYKSWVMNPHNLYPVCKECFESLTNGRIVDRIANKWKGIQIARNEEKTLLRASKRLESQDKKEVETK